MPENNILLLENEKELERILTLLLKQANFRVTSCHSAGTALAEIVSKTGVDQTDLLIIDIPGPDCEGSMLLKQLQDRGITLPLIVITPYGSEGIIDALGSSTPHLHLLYSPFEPAELMNCINQITRNSNF
ncbi:MAG: response regulator [Desulfobulbaceae bacterium]|nr:response regulator [Desulfobulbaceae bacterium]